MIKVNKTLMKRIYFVTGNQGKIIEAKEILKVEIIPVRIEKLDEVQTNDPLECVSKKAISAFNLFKKPVLVDDTSLFFSSLNGLPGVFIDYFMDAFGNDGLLRLLVNEKDRTAVAQTSLCYFDGKESLVVFGKVKGRISEEKKGENGFGWDAIFVPDGSEKTFAEMSIEEKNKISMRRLALEQLKKSRNS